MEQSPQRSYKARSGEGSTVTLPLYVLLYERGTAHCAVPLSHHIHTGHTVSRGLCSDLLALRPTGLGASQLRISPLPERRYLLTHCSLEPVPHGIHWATPGPKVTGKGDTVGRGTLPLTPPP